MTLSVVHCYSIIELKTDSGIYNNFFSISSLISVGIVIFLILVLFCVLIILSHVEIFTYRYLGCFIHTINLNENNLDQIISKNKMFPYYITRIHFELKCIIFAFYLRILKIWVCLFIWSHINEKFNILNIYLSSKHLKNSRYLLYMVLGVWKFQLYS